MFFEHLNTKHPQVFFFFAGLLQPALLIAFSCLTQNLPKMPATLYILLVLYVLLLPVARLLREVAATPSRSYERVRKVAMFEPAPIAVAPTPVISDTFFTQNAFRFVSFFSIFYNYILFLLITLTPAYLAMWSPFALIALSMFT